MSIEIGKQYQIDMATYVPYYQEYTHQQTAFRYGDVVTVEDTDYWEDEGVDAAYVAGEGIVSWLPSRFLIPVANS